MFHHQEKKRTGLQGELKALSKDYVPLNHMFFQLKWRGEKALKVLSGYTPKWNLHM